MASVSQAGVAQALAWSQVADTLAQTQERQMLNQQRAQGIQMNQQTLASDLLLRQALSGMSGQVEAPQPAPANIPTDDSLGGIVQKQLQGMQRQERVYRDLARTPGIEPKRAIELMKSADDIAKNISTEVGRLTDDRRKDFEQIGGIAGSVNDPQSLQAAWSQIEQINPAMLKRLPVDFGQDGRPLPTMKTFAAMNQLGTASTTRAQQMADAARQASERRLVDEQAARDVRFQEEQARLREAQTDRNQNAALAQQGIQAQREIANDARKTGIEQRAESQAQTISNELKTDPQVREFADHKKALVTGINYVFNADGTPKPEGAVGSEAWKNHDSARDFMLSRQFISVVHPSYRGSLGDLKELSSLANLPEKLAKAITSVAAGKTLAQSDRVNMVNAMKSVVAAENEDQLVREDQALQKIQRLKLPEGTDYSIYVTPYAIRPAKETPGVSTPAAPAAKVDYTEIGGEGGVKVQGRGTDAAPYMPTTQEQVDALPRGAIVIVGGKKFRKT